MLSVCSFGSQEPDRQMPDQAVLTEQAVFQQDFAVVSFITNTTSLEAHTYFISDQEAELDISDQEVISDMGLNIPVRLHKELTDLVVEEDKNRAWGHYVLPIWEYDPIIEPPVTLLHS